MDYALQTNSLTKSFGPVYTLIDLSIKVKRGIIYALLGGHNSGKSTLLNILVGAFSATSGNFHFFENPDYQQEYKRIGYMPQTQIHHENMSISENLTYFAKIYGVIERDSIHQIIHFLKLDNIEKKPVKWQSLSIRRRLDMAIALLGSPDLLLLDNPFQGLDAKEKDVIVECLCQLNHIHHMTILIAEQHYEDVSKFADCLGILNSGKLVAQFTPPELALHCDRCVKIRTKQLLKAVPILGQNYPQYEILSDNVIRLVGVTEQSSAINTLLVSSGISVDEIWIDGENEENYLLELMGCDNR